MAVARPMPDYVPTTIIRRSSNHPPYDSAGDPPASVPAIGGSLRGPPRRPDGRVRSGAARLASPAVTANGPALPVRCPRLDDQNRFFWTSGADGKLRFLRCDDCARLVHPPAPVCPDCLGRNLAPTEVSGRAVLESFTVNHQQWVPGADSYVVAWVSIAEQPDVRLTSKDACLCPTSSPSA